MFKVRADSSVFEITENVPGLQVYVTHTDGNAELVIAEISTSTIGEYICEARSRYEAIQTPTHVFMFGKFYLQ